MSNARKHYSVRKDQLLTFRFDEKRLSLLVNRSSQPYYRAYKQRGFYTRTVNSILFSPFPLLKLCRISYHHILSLTSIPSRQGGLLALLLLLLTRSLGLNPRHGFVGR